MRTIYAGLAVIAALFPSTALAQQSGRFNLDCSQDAYDRGASRPSSSSRATYSIDLDRGLACQQSSSIVKDNLCRPVSPISRSGNVISFIGNTAQVKIDLASGRVERASTFITSRGTCTRTAFTSFPGDQPQQAATSSPADSPAVPGQARAPAQPTAQHPVVAARLWVRDVVGQAASARGLASYPANHARCIWRFMPAAGAPAAAGSGWVVDWTRTTRLPTLSSPVTVDWPIPSTDQVQRFRLADGDEARGFLAALRLVIADCAPAALGTQGSPPVSASQGRPGTTDEAAKETRPPVAATIPGLERAFMNLPAEISDIMGNKRGRVTGATAKGCQLTVHADSSDPGDGSLDFNIRVDADGRPRRIAPQAIALFADGKLVGIQVPRDLDGVTHEARFSGLEAALKSYWQACVGS